MIYTFVKFTLETLTSTFLDEEIFGLYVTFMRITKSSVMMREIYHQIHIYLHYCFTLQLTRDQIM